MKKERIDSFDFMRSVTAWLIVIYHFAGICVTTPQFQNFPFLYTHANGVWGENTSVNIFFMLSGASLYYNHADISPSSLKRYYFDRFKGIFPMLYMVWFFLYYQKATTVGNLFYNGSPKSMLLTLIGMDGYLSYRCQPNYYFIGEWFIGALVLLYLVYPLLVWCMKHLQIPVTLLLGLGTFSLAADRVQAHFIIQRERNLIVCMFAFWLGMLFMEHKDALSAWWITALIGGLAVLFLLVPMPFDPFICIQIIPVGLFLLSYQAGRYVMKNSTAKRFFAYPGSMSYAIFLLQHVVMSQILDLFKAYSLTVPQEFLIMAATFVMIYLFADIVTRLNKMLTHSGWFLKIQSVFYA